MAEQLSTPVQFWHLTESRLYPLLHQLWRRLLSQQWLKTYPGNNYDLVAFFDCLHDMGDPVGAIAHVKETLKPDGTLMLVEPFAHERLADNLNTIGRLLRM